MGHRGRDLAQSAWFQHLCASLHTWLCAGWPSVRPRDSCNKWKLTQVSLANCVSGPSGSRFQKCCWKSLVGANLYMEEIFLFFLVTWWFLEVAYVMFAPSELESCLYDARESCLRFASIFTLHSPPPISSSTISVTHPHGGLWIPHAFCGGECWQMVSAVGDDSLVLLPWQRRSQGEEQRGALFSTPSQSFSLSAFLVFSFPMGLV